MAIKISSWEAKWLPFLKEVPEMDREKMRDACKLESTASVPLLLLRALFGRGVVKMESDREDFRCIMETIGRSKLIEDYKHLWPNN
jgi:hypothetical protein